MLLKLSYKEFICHATRAAFIRGSSPGDWLLEIGRWDIPTGQLECYLVPRSIASVEPVGLFVIFKGANVPTEDGLFEPYGVVGGKLYLPVRAGLFPQVTPAELNELLLWERQLFHPSIGLVGFSAADRLNLADLLEGVGPSGTDWSLAHPGLPAKPSLAGIDVQQPTLEEVMESFKELIDPKALQDILEGQEDKSTLVRDLFTNLNGGLLNGALNVLQKIKDAWPAGDGSEGGRDEDANAPQDPRMFDRLEKWIRENLAEIQRKRENEIQRLLNLFDKDTDEALKYAIPLDSPYLNRGTSAPTSHLPRHPADFDLSKLGGGGVTDTWNLSGQYYELRRKYQAAAQQETEAGNHKKAAYIYAHLLGDFYAAARVLESGKHYREAAALYKDHLRNLSAAAECLERGGLLLEAIPLYESLHKHEKAGDLYLSVGQTGPAGEAYERGVEATLRGGDYLEASRLLNDKLARPDRARETLLEGWKGSNQSEPCLKRYFDLVATGEAGNLNRRVQEIFAHDTPASKKGQFLHALVHAYERHSDPDLADTATGIAYRIISEQVREGNLAQLPTLNKFLPEDPLLPSDVSRFTAVQRANPRQTSAALVMQLDQTIRWVSAIAHRNQFLALGVKEGHLHLARGNWYGNFEYHSWSLPVSGAPAYSLVADPYYSNRVMVLAPHDLALDQKTLPRNKYFDEELVVNGAYGLTKGLLGLATNGEGGVSMLKAHNYALTLYHYYADGSLKNSTDCRFAGVRPLRPASMMAPASFCTGMIYRNGKYYAFRGNVLLKIAEDGITEGIDVGATIFLVAATTHHARLKIAVATDNGILLLSPVQGNLKAESDFFALEAAPVDLRFVSAHHLVVAGKYEAQVYSVADNAVQAQQTFRCQSPIVAVLTTADRHQWALLEEKGRITVLPVDS